MSFKLLLHFGTSPHNLDFLVVFKQEKKRWLSENGRVSMATRLLLPFDRGSFDETATLQGRQTLKKRPDDGTDDGFGCANERLATAADVFSGRINVVVISGLITYWRVRRQR